MIPATWQLCNSSHEYLTFLHLYTYKQIVATPIYLRTDCAYTFPSYNHTSVCLRPMMNAMPKEFLFTTNKCIVYQFYNRPAFGSHQHHTLTLATRDNTIQNNTTSDSSKLKKVCSEEEGKCQIQTIVQITACHASEIQLPTK